MILVLTAVIWGPIYYIITGNDPIDSNLSFPLDLTEKIIDWYFIYYNPE